MLKTNRMRSWTQTREERDLVAGTTFKGKLFWDKQGVERAAGQVQLRGRKREGVILGVFKADDGIPDHES